MDAENKPKPAYLDIIWAEEWKNWGVIAFDTEGNQIGEGDWWTYQERAHDAAIDYMTSCPTIQTLNVYTKSGKLRKRETRSVVPSWFNMTDYPRTDDTRVPKGVDAKAAVIHLITHLEALNRLQVREGHDMYELYLQRRVDVRLAIMHFMNLIASDDKRNLRIMDGFDHYS